ncbi:MAG: hypothetical protein KY476_02280 [Planctomycetes bacterium]|nr:hypothetical protein [Planctomycetota bacterium]
MNLLPHAPTRGRLRRPLWSLLTLGVVVAIAADVSAQPGGGRFGGRDGGGRSFGGFDRGPLGQLERDSVQAELGLTEEQKARIAEIRESSRPDFSAFRGQDLSEEERRERFRQLMEDSRRQTEAKLKEALRPEQYTRLDQISLQESGPRAFTREDVAADLKLSDVQKQELERLNEERSAAFREANLFRAPTEERAKFDAEWNAKLTAVLTPEQQKRWQQRLGTPFNREAPAGAPTATAGSGTTASTPAPPKPALITRPGSTIVNADGSQPDVVASFELPSDAPAAQDDEYDPSLISFNFENAPWPDVLDMFARKAGLTLDALDVPSGSFTYKDTRAYTPLKALDVLHGYLLQRGHVMVRRDKFLVVLNIDEREIPPNLVPRLTLSQLEDLHEKGIENELVNVIIPLEPGLEAEQVAPEVEELLGPQRKVVALKAANSLAVRDTVSHLMNVRDLLSRMSAPANPEDAIFKSYQLENILAGEAEDYVRKLFGLSSSVQNVSSAVRYSSSYSQYGGSSSYRGGYPGSSWGRGDGRDRGRDSRDNRTPPPTAPAQRPVQLAADTRTNSLLATATPSQHTVIEEVVASIDVPLDPKIAGIVRNNTPQFRVYKVTTAEPDEVAKTLTALMPNVVINDDDQRGLGFVHILATPAEHEKVAEYIRLMDGASTQSIDVVRVNPRYDPSSVATMLNQIFLSETDPPTIMGEHSTRSLMVKGSPEQIVMVRKTMTSLGLEGSADDTAGPTGRGRYRQVATMGRDPEKIAHRLKELLEGSQAVPNRINVEVIGEGGDQPRELEDSSPRIELESTGGDAELQEFQPTRRRATASETDDANRDPVRRTSRDEGGKPVTSVDLPALRGDVEVDFVPGTGLMILKGPEAELNKLASPDRGVSFSTVSYQGPEDASEIEATPPNPPLARGGTEQSPPLAKEGPGGVSEAGDAQLKQLFNDLEELLDLEDLAEQQRTQSPGDPAQPQPDAGNAADAQPDQKPAPRENRRPAEGASRAAPPINIEVVGGKLYIYSADEQALDEVELALSELLAEMPAETVWTVFYLRATDVVDAADMLSQLMPDTTIASLSSASSGGLLGGLSGGISGMASGLMNATGLDSLTEGPQTLKIIPHLASNSIWVSGPVDKVRDVKTFLERLDSDETPESLRDRVPRTIDVNYTDVDEMADMIRELYKDYLEDPNDRRQQQQGNPLAMLMGGNRGGSTGGRAPGIRLTLATDRRTSQLVVSCSNALFEQIKHTVELRDLAAKEAKRTVRFVAVDAGSSLVLQETLGRALPNVRVSTTGQASQRTPRTGQNGQTTGTQQNDGNRDRNGGGGSSNEDAERAERFRRFMEMRQQQQQQGGGPSGRGGDSGSSGRPSFFGRTSTDGGRGFSGFGGFSRGDSDRGRGR